jgi:hypothetical protein
MQALRDFLGTIGGQNFIFSAFAFVLFLRMLGRAGLPRAWALLALLPVIGPTLVFAVMAWRRWPNRYQPPQPAPAETAAAS